MDFIYAELLKKGFDTDAIMSESLPLSHDSRIDRIKDKSTRRGAGSVIKRNPLMTNDLNKDTNEDLLQEFYDWQEKEYYNLQDYYKEYLRDLGYGCIEGVSDGYENFCLDWYKEEMPSYKIPLLANDWI